MRPGPFPSRYPMSNHSCLAFFATLLTSVPAAAQSGSCLPFEPDNTIEWPGPATVYGNAAAFGRIVLADLDGDDSAEGVVLAGGVAVMLQKVAVYDAPRSIQFPSGAPPLSVADLATLHDAGPVGPDGVLKTDGVLMTDSRGLFL